MTDERRIDEILSATALIDNAGHGFRWHLSAIEEALQQLSGFNKYASGNYNRSNTCLEEHACRQCGAADGELRSALIRWAGYEHMAWMGSRWEHAR